MTTIEVTSSAIRLCREQRGKLIAIESHPVAEGMDPLDALAAAPLPRPLGRTTVVLQHQDMLLRTMLQPPCPPERLDRLVRFELQSARGEDTDPVAIAWHLVKGGGGGDMRVLALVTKQALIERVKKALARHEGRLDGLIHPGVALFHAWRRQVGDAGGDAVLVDLGGKQVHLALIREGELLMVRSQGPGMEQLAKQIAEAQGMPEPEATKLMTKLGKGSPEALHELIRRQAQATAGLIANNIRFTKAQLQLDQFEPKQVHLAGAGAQVYGFVEALRERLQLPTRILNPFAGVLSTLDAATLDRQAALPSPWTVTLGAALGAGSGLELDAVSDEKARKATFWRTDGALRIAIAIAATLVILAGLRQSLALFSANGAVATLDDAGNGLVPKARAIQVEIDQLRDATALARGQLAFLDGERRSGRIAVELLAAIAEQQSPETCPVVLREYRLTRQPGAVLIDLEGFAETAPGKSTADVLRGFERQLVRAYEPIGSLVAQSPKIRPDKLEFHYKVAIPDQPLRVLAKTSTPAGKLKQLTLTVAADDGLDPRGVAGVALDRALTGEDSARIIVVGLADGKVLAEFSWSPRQGFEKTK